MTASPGSSPKPNPKPADQPPTADPPVDLGRAKDDGQSPDGGQSPDAEHRAKHEATDAQDMAKGKLADAKEAAGAAADAAKDKAAEAKSKAADAAAEAKQKAADAIDSARAKAAEARDTAKDKLDRSEPGPAAAVAGSAAPRPPELTKTQPDEPTIGELVSAATTAMSTLVRSEVELAKLELRSTVKNAGTGVGLFVGAAVVLVFSLTFGFIALAEGINALGLARWLSFLIVFGFQLLVVGLFVFIGIKKVKAVRAPEKTIKTTRETVDYLKTKRG